MSNDAHTVAIDIAASVVISVAALSSPLLLLVVAVVTAFSPWMLVVAVAVAIFSLRCNCCVVVAI